MEVNTKHENIKTNKSTTSNNFNMYQIATEDENLFMDKLTDTDHLHKCGECGKGY